MALSLTLSTEPARYAIGHQYRCAHLDRAWVKRILLWLVVHKFVTYRTSRDLGVPDLL